MHAKRNFSPAVSSSIFITLIAISENTEILDGNYYPSIPIFGPIVENTDLFGVVQRKYRFFSAL